MFNSLPAPNNFESARLSSSVTWPIFSTQSHRRTVSFQESAESNGSHNSSAYLAHGGMNAADAAAASRDNKSETEWLAVEALERAKVCYHHVQAILFIVIEMLTISIQLTVG